MLDVGGSPSASVCVCCITNDQPQNAAAAILVTENHGRGRAFLIPWIVRAPRGRLRERPSLEFEAERDRDEVRVAVVGEDEVQPHLGERFEPAQVEVDTTAEVETKLGLRVADVDAVELGCGLQLVDPEAADDERPHGRGGITKRIERVGDEVDHAEVAAEVPYPGKLAAEIIILETIAVIRELAAPRNRQGRLLVLEQPPQMPAKVRPIAEVSKRDRRAKRAADLPRSRRSIRRTRRTLSLCRCCDQQRTGTYDQAAKKPGHVASPIRGWRDPNVRAARNIVTHAR